MAQRAGHQIVIVDQLAGGRVTGAIGNAARTGFLCRGELKGTRTGAGPVRA